MIFTHQDQISYTRLALGLLDNEKTDANSIESILNFGELIKKHASEDNALIYDATEYLYEQLRLLRGDEGAYDDSELRSRLEQEAVN